MHVCIFIVKNLGMLNSDIKTIIS